MRVCGGIIRLSDISEIRNKNKYVQVWCVCVSCLHVSDVPEKKEYIRVCAHACTYACTCMCVCVHGVDTQRERQTSKPGSQCRCRSLHLVSSVKVYKPLVASVKN